jgi:methylmalonyl-CoA/ethylmalonyl-CoA epimerase
LQLYETNDASQYSSSPPERSIHGRRAACKRLILGDLFQRLWQLGQLNHVAIAVPNLTEATSFYKNVLGARVSAPQDLPEHGVTTVFVELGNTKLELLHPLGKESPIQNFLNKRPMGGMHVRRITRIGTYR